MTTIHFKALDNVSGNTFYSKDFRTLREFFNLFDNVQHSIQLISRGEDIVRLVEMEENFNGQNYNTKEENQQQNNYQNQQQSHTKKEFDPIDFVNTIGKQVFFQGRPSPFGNTNPNKKNNDIDIEKLLKAATNVVKVGKIFMDSQNKKQG
jgi:hypothetical protein